MTASIPLHRYDAIVCIIFMQSPLRSGSRAQLLNPLRISHRSVSSSLVRRRVRIYSPKVKYLSVMQLYTFLNYGILIENCQPTSRKSSLQIPKKQGFSRVYVNRIVTKPSFFRVGPVTTASHIPPKRVKLACKRKVRIYSPKVKYLSVTHTVHRTMVLYHS